MGDGQRSILRVDERSFFGGRRGFVEGKGGYEFEVLS